MKDLSPKRAELMPSERQSIINENLPKLAMAKNLSNRTNKKLILSPKSSGIRSPLVTSEIKNGRNRSYTSTVTNFHPKPKVAELFFKVDEKISKNDLN